MIEVILRFLRPPVFDDLEKNRITSQLHYVVLAGVSTASSIALFNFISNIDPRQVATVIPGVAVIGLLVLHLLLRRGKSHFVALGIIFIGYVGVTASLLLSGDGIRDSSSSIFPLLLILSSVFLDSKTTLRAGILTVVTIASVWLAEYTGAMETNFDTESTTALLVLLTAVSFATIFLRSTVNRIMESGAMIREQATALKANNQVLQEAQQALQAQTIELSNLNSELTREIAERERTDAVLRQRQKQESIGLLAGGVAHDFNNLLTSILGQSSLALRKLEPDHAARQNIEKAIDSTRRGEDLTRQLLAYAGHSNLLVEPLNLNRVIQANVSLLESLIQHGEELAFSLADQLPAIEADRGQLQQILMNLIINASEAIMHDHGLIRVMTDASVMSSAELVTTGVKTINGDSAQPEQYVILSVQDNGHGIDNANREKIFDPFFTTKETGHGLGLSAIVGIVRALDGGLTVNSQVDQGSIFSIYLPASQEQPLSAVPHSLPPQISACSGTILVVDDEKSIIESVSEIFQSVGYKVMTAFNGSDGIARFRQHCDAIDLVLLDIHMPGLNGVDTFRQMRQIRSDVPVIFSSGYTVVDLPSSASGLDAHEFLPKPYDVNVLLDMVNRIICAQGPE